MSFLSEKPREECGVFAIFAPGEDVSRLTYFGLYTLQHRGQESAGIVTSDGQQLFCHKKMGLVSQVFNEATLSRLGGYIAIGHTRYSTTGSSIIKNAQPLVFDSKLGYFALAHNGNLVNLGKLKNSLNKGGYSFNTNSDSEIIGKIISRQYGKNWAQKISKGLTKIKGSYSLVITTLDKLFALRDPLGVRPLVLGSFNKGWVVASETCALDTIGAKYIREINPGEGICIDKDGIHQFMCGQPEAKTAFCIFEYIYFARPDSIINNKLVYAARQEMGRNLYREHPVQADFQSCPCMKVLSKVAISVGHLSNQTRIFARWG